MMMWVPYIGNATAHTCSEVASRIAKHNHTSACHIFAAMVTRTLNDRNRSRVAHAEAFTHFAVDVKFARGCTVKTCVAGDDILFSLEVVAATCWWQYRDTAA